MEHPASTTRALGQADTADGEISLPELVSILWEGKRLILTVTAAIVCAVAAYVFLTPAIYEVRSGINTTDTVKRAYNTFIQHLTSESLRRQFFESVYLPAKLADNSKVDQADQATRAENLWQRLQKELSIREDKGGTGGATRRMILTLQGENPQQLSDWTKQYIQSAITLAQQEWLNDLDSVRQQRIQSLNEKIAAQRAVAQLQRNYRIEQLQAALVLAQANESQTTSNAANSVTPYRDEFSYLRGSRVLKAELEELESRSNNDPFIPELPHLLEHKQLLENMNLSAIQIGVAQVDFPAITPTLPIKPKKALPLFTSVVLGAILGAIIAIGRGLYGKQK